jgi:hypothetical protein
MKVYNYSTQALYSQCTAACCQGHARAILWSSSLSAPNFHIQRNVRLRIGHGMERPPNNLMVERAKKRFGRTCPASYLPRDQHVISATASDVQRPLSQVAMCKRKQIPIPPSHWTSDDQHSHDRLLLLSMSSALRFRCLTGCRKFWVKLGKASVESWCWFGRPLLLNKV